MTDHETLQAHADEMMKAAQAKAAEAKAARDAARTEVLAKMKADMLAFNITYSDLGAKFVGGKRKATNGAAGKPKEAAAPMYRSPDGKSTWSGRGRQPNWIKGTTPAEQAAMRI